MKYFNVRVVQTSSPSTRLASSVVEGARGPGVHGARGPRAGDARAAVSAVRGVHRGVRRRRERVLGRVSIVVARSPSSLAWHELFGGADTAHGGVGGHHRVRVDGAVRMLDAAQGRQRRDGQAKSRARAAPRQRARRASTPRPKGVAATGADRVGEAGAS